MVNESTEVLERAEGECVICFLPAQIQRNYQVFAAHTGRCERCGHVATAYTAVEELAKSPILRRKAQWVNRRFFQGGANYHYWVSTGAPFDPSEFPNQTRLQDVDTFGIPETVGAWRAQVLRTIGEVAQSREELWLTPDIVPLFWYRTLSELDWILNQLQGESLLTWTRDHNSIQTGVIRPNLAGWQAIESAQAGERRQSRTVFVASWFDTGMRPFFEQGVAPALQDVNLQPVWLNALEDVDKIDDRIFAEIRQARFVVCDFTGHRQAVYFEAGFAMGLGLPVLWTCREDQIGEASFDTRQYSHILWTTPGDLKTRLVARIRAFGLER